MNSLSREGEGFIHFASLRRGIVVSYLDTRRLKPKGLLILNLILKIWTNLLRVSLCIPGSLPTRQVAIKNKQGNLSTVEQKWWWIDWLTNCEWNFNFNTYTSIVFSQFQPFSTPLLLQNFGNVTVFSKVRNIPNFDAIVTNFDAFMDVKMNMRYGKELPFK